MAAAAVLGGELGGCAEGSLSVTSVVVVPRLRNPEESGSIIR